MVRIAVAILIVLDSFAAVPFPSTGQAVCERPAHYPAKSQLLNVEQQADAWFDAVTKLFVANLSGIDSIPVFPHDPINALVAYIECHSQKDVAFDSNDPEEPYAAHAVLLGIVKANLNTPFIPACSKVCNAICESENKSETAFHYRKSHNHRFKYLMLGTPGSHILAHAAYFANNPLNGPIGSVGGDFSLWDFLSIRGDGVIVNRCRKDDMERSLIHDVLYHAAKPDGNWTVGRDEKCARGNEILACTLASLELSVIAEYGCREVGVEGFAGDLAEKAIAKVRDFANELIKQHRAVLGFTEAPQGAK